jgi:hypothetical protein
MSALLSLGVRFAALAEARKLTVGLVKLEKDLRYEWRERQRRQKTQHAECSNGRW